MSYIRKYISQIRKIFNHTIYMNFTFFENYSMKSYKIEYYLLNLQKQKMRNISAFLTL